MATTVGGLPYPVGTDKVVDGDDAIKALAEAVDARPYAALRRTTALSIIAGTVVLNDNFDSVAARNFTHAAGVLTVGRSGVYAVTFGGEYANQINGTRQGFLVLNSTDPANAVIADKRSAQAAGTSGITFGGTIVRSFVAGDRLQIVLFQDAGPALNVTNLSIGFAWVATT